MDAFDAIKRRRSVRVYARKPVSRQTLETIADAARYAPTARNEQPWQFVALTDSQKIQKLAALTDHGKFIASAPACIVVFCSDTKYYLEDGSAATQNIMLAACALGVGSCWVAGDKKPYCGQVNELLGVPAEYRLVSIVALGYPDSPLVFKEAEKRPLSGMLHWEKF